MSLLDAFAGFFGKKTTPQPVAKRPKGKGTEKKRLAKQVYEGSCPQMPEWTKDLDQSHLIDACIEHAVCKFTPHIEIKKIMSARTGLDGNLETEYEGIACDCGAIKSFGKQVAQRDGFVQPYRYVDLNHILSCCCDKPRKCTFYALAAGEEHDLSKRRKRVGE